MTSPRRRIVRPPSPSPHPRSQQRQQKLTAKLDKAQADLKRWLAKLRRAFHSVDKQLQTIDRLHRQLSQEERLHEARD